MLRVEFSICTKNIQRAQNFFIHWTRNFPVPFFNKKNTFLYIYVWWVLACHLIKKVHKSSTFSLPQSDSMYTQYPFQMCLIMSFEAHLPACHLVSVSGTHTQGNMLGFYPTPQQIWASVYTKAKRQDKQRKSICGFPSHRWGNFLRSFWKMKNIFDLYVVAGMDETVN